jgi:hypothetical protein
MQLHTQEHYDIIAAFERIFGQKPHYMRLDKEPKDQWARGCIYQNAETNAMFKGFRHGVAYGIGVSRT